MSALKSVFSYTDYRQLIRDALESKGYSYRSFSEKHPNVAKFSMLGAALSKGRGGTKFKPARTFSAETLARLGRVLKFNEAEITHLILLKFENEAEVLPGTYGGTFLEIAKALLNEHRLRSQTKNQMVKDEQYSHSDLSRAAASVIDALPESSRKKVAAEILPAAKAVLSRQRKKPGVRTLASNIERFEELTR
jgi:hypothetical protein